MAGAVQAEAVVCAQREGLTSMHQVVEVLPAACAIQGAAIARDSGRRARQRERKGPNNHFEMIARETA